MLRIALISFLSLKKRVKEGKTEKNLRDYEFVISTSKDIPYLLHLPTRSHAEPNFK